MSRYRLTPRGELVVNVLVMMVVITLGVVLTFAYWT